MDAFMERLSHKKVSQEMIQANSAAEAAKMEELQNRMDEYDALLQDMRKVNLKATENMEQMQRLLEESLNKIEALKEEKNEIKAEGNAFLSEINRQIEELEPKFKEKMDESFQRSDDFLHRENVKVYRNVQAAVAEELSRQTDTLTQGQKEGIQKQKALLPISVVIMIMVIADIIINLFGIVIKF